MYIRVCVHPETKSAALSSHSNRTDSPSRLTQQHFIMYSKENINISISSIYSYISASWMSLLFLFFCCFCFFILKHYSSCSLWTNNTSASHQAAPRAIEDHDVSRQKTGHWGTLNSEVNPTSTVITSEFCVCWLGLGCLPSALQTSNVHHICEAA